MNTNKRRWRRLVSGGCLTFLLAATAWGHVGSPDVFFEGKAGPYPVFVTIRPPVVIPGVAEVELRTSAIDIDTIRITPLPLTGEGAKFAPTPDKAVRSKADAQFFTGSLWMMATGSWQVRVQVQGARGAGELSVPVPAMASRTRGMDSVIASILVGLMVLLSVGLISIIGAAVRESQLEPGVEAGPERRRRARIGMLVSTVVVLGLLYLGNLWWGSEASAYDRYVYKPIEMSAGVEMGERLVLRLRDPGWISSRLLDDFIPDHNHLMHLYVIRLPEMERVWHLHPEMAASGVFEQKLPPMPAGRYQLFADVVHKSGFPETMTAEVELPPVEGRPLEGDDSTGSGPMQKDANFAGAVAVLPDGNRMVWDRDPQGYEAKKASLFRFRVEDPNGKSATGMELYMGMMGHAAFVRADRSVFAHVHPSGSVPMAALGLTNTAADPHAGHAGGDGLPAEVSFPYGFPRPGAYRIFVQIKRAGKVETGVFDVAVQ